MENRGMSFDSLKYFLFVNIGKKLKIQQTTKKHAKFPSRYRKGNPKFKFEKLFEFWLFFVQKMIDLLQNVLIHIYLHLYWC